MALGEDPLGVAVQLEGMGRPRDVAQPATEVAGQCEGVVRVMPKSVDVTSAANGLAGRLDGTTPGYLTPPAVPENEELWASATQWPLTARRSDIASPVQENNAALDAPVLCEKEASEALEDSSESATAAASEMSGHVFNALPLRAASSVYASSGIMTPVSESAMQVAAHFATAVADPSADAAARTWHGFVDEDFSDGGAPSRNGQSPDVRRGDQSCMGLIHARRTARSASRCFDAALHGFEPGGGRRSMAAAPVSDAPSMASACLLSASPCLGAALHHWRVGSVDRNTVVVDGSDAGLRSAPSCHEVALAQCELVDDQHSLDVLDLAAEFAAALEGLAAARDDAAAGARPE
eukprot:NODE_9834_length_1396_cov_1.657998.p1 GENE.NODE_9834_length_1396_cov_1.657998~~NODE_9834_length_1396_cov_1.657998.p1  ORF type:complete len:392 (-),score=55.42 NODE_9834_length_1396_cov_1.657998:220-1272(-)